MESTRPREREILIVRSAGGRLVIIREGHGEAGAVENLVSRIGTDLGVIPTVLASIPPSPRIVVTNSETAIHACEVASRLRPDAVLLTADLDDYCPAEHAPAIAADLRERSFNFPVALVFFHREYETLAISVAAHLGARELRSPAGQVVGILKTPDDLPSDAEIFRDAKGWVGRNLMGGASYKPTTHQLPLTRAMRLDELRAAGLSSYRRLENAVQFLGREVAGGNTGVYPPM